MYAKIQNLNEIAPLIHSVTYRKLPVHSRKVLMVHLNCQRVGNGRGLVQFSYRVEAHGDTYAKVIKVSQLPPTPGVYNSVTLYPENTSEYKMLVPTIACHLAYNTILFVPEDAHRLGERSLGWTPIPIQPNEPPLETEEPIPF